MSTQLLDKNDKLNKHSKITGGVKNVQIRVMKELQMITTIVLQTYAV